MKVEKITSGIYFIEGEDEFMPDSHVYIIGEPDSHDLSLVDAGLFGKGNKKIQAIKEAGINLKDIKRVIMTHTHLDHIGALKEIKEKLPNLEIWVHKTEAQQLEEGDERTVYGMEMFKQMFQMQFGIKPGEFGFKVDRKLEGGETLNIGNMKWRVIHVPGHSMGSIALYNPHKMVLISGDVIYADYNIGRFDLFGASGKQLKESLFQLAKLKVRILLPGHNRIVKNVEHDYILKTATQWEPYLI